MRKLALLAIGLALLMSYASGSRASQAETRAAISRRGTLGGAASLIEVPANWRGGIHRGPGKGEVRPPPIGIHILSEGYAWIASGYREREYQPHLFIEDLVALHELFVKEIGAPRWSVIYGQSMGGHIAVASLDLRPGFYQGGLAECGLVDGIGI